MLWQRQAHFRHVDRKNARQCGTDIDVLPNIDLLGFEQAFVRGADHRSLQLVPGLIQVREGGIQLRLGFFQLRFSERQIGGRLRTLDRAAVFDPVLVGHFRRAFLCGEPAAGTGHSGFSALYRGDVVALVYMQQRVTFFKVPSHLETVGNIDNSAGNFRDQCGGGARRHGTLRSHRDADILLDCFDGIHQ